MSEAQAVTRAELEQAVAKARAEERRKRRWLALALAAALLALAGGGVWVYQREAARRDAAQREVERALEEARKALEEAEKLKHQGHWGEARAALRRAEAVLAIPPEGRTKELRRRARELHEGLEMLQRLEEIRLPADVVNGRFDPEAADRAYAEVFAAAGEEKAASDRATEQMRASRCYRASRAPKRLGCASCHDPRGDPAPDKKGAHYRAACLRCHAPAGCSLPLAVRRRTSKEDSCIACHMPRTRSEGSREALTDHRIPRGPKASAPPAPARRPTPDEVAAAYRKAIARKPDDAGAYNGLGRALHAKGDLDGAIACHREAIRLNPGVASFHRDLGKVLFDKKDHDSAIAAFRQAIRLDPKLDGVYALLGDALAAKGKLDEAVACYRNALRTDPPGECGPAALGLANALARLGKYAQAVEAYSSALRFVPEDAGSGVRLAAARAAVRAAEGKDPEKLGDGVKARLRKQALDWLKADLAAWQKRVDKGDAKARREAARALAGWRKDADLAGVRDKEALAKLPAGEREAWQKLWAEVDALRKKSGEK